MYAPLSCIVDQVFEKIKEYILAGDFTKEHISDACLHLPLADFTILFAKLDAFLEENQRKFNLNIEDLVSYRNGWQECPGDFYGNDISAMYIQYGRMRLAITLAKQFLLEIKEERNKNT